LRRSLAAAARRFGASRFGAGRSGTGAAKRGRFPIACLLALILLPMLGSGTRAEAPLALERTIALKDVSGRIDHLAVDLPRRRLFVAELGNGTVDVVDLATGTVAHRLAGLKEPQGIGYVPGADILAVASAGDGSVRLFRGADLSQFARIDLGGDADNIRADPRDGMLVVGFGRGGLAVIDPAAGRLVRRIRLQAHPEGFQLDPVARRAFVNVPDARQIAVVDLSAGQQIATWGVPDLRANFPMAVDPAAGHLAVVFRDPARLAWMDRASGRVDAVTPSCGDADDVFFDARRRRLYVSCGEGSVGVWTYDSGAVRPFGAVKTSSGARTSLFVPELDRLFVAARAGFLGLGSDAAILVFRPVD
jgi:hypothetical protein